jgi:hypothetical protein
MKVYMKPIESIAWFNRDGVLHPLRYRIIAEDETCQVVRIKRTITRAEEKIAGTRMLIFSL